MIGNVTITVNYKVMAMMYDQILIMVTVTYHWSNVYPVCQLRTSWLLTTILNVTQTIWKDVIINERFESKGNQINLMKCS